MTRFHSSFPELAVHSNLLLKRKLPKECEQHALGDAAADVSVRVRNGRDVRAHLPVRKSTSQSGAMEGTIQRSAARFVHWAARIVRRHIDICRPAWALA